MSYLDEIAEARPYKVIVYEDHNHSYTRYFESFDNARKYFNGLIGHRSNAEYTAGIALISTATGEPIYRQTWRV